jgi:hypothetical protein
MQKYLIVVFLLVIIYLMAPSHCRALAKKTSEQIGGAVRMIMLNSVGGKDYNKASEVMNLEVRGNNEGDPVVVEGVSQILNVRS